MRSSADELLHAILKLDKRHGFSIERDKSRPLAIVLRMPGADPAGLEGEQVVYLEDKGWHMYSLKVPDNRYIPIDLRWDVDLRQWVGPVIKDAGGTVTIDAVTEVLATFANFSQEMKIQFVQQDRPTHR
ncbi:hypothetical protein LXT21_44180 [Myxococcus sp. K38C18041901]|uniref:hypothetical protein n=1 Tax=Myxococcus guangdongensis TaxID=2906760 RepID=UPI0020A6F5BE|nr:hypothetical protein [Myxococcus guangdongensis]MCP3065788.1 hypothetical protein [Myxococcus guangdongensis]